MAASAEVIAARAAAKQLDAETRRATEDAAATRRRADESRRATLARQAAAERATDRQTRWKKRRAAVTKAVGWLAADADAVAAMTVYTAAVGVALYGQLTAAHGHGLPIAVAIPTSIALEGWGLAAARTALRLRLVHAERARREQAATVFAALLVAVLNVAGHWPRTVVDHGNATQHGSLITAAVYGSLSLGALGMWEMRSGARHRPALRARGLIADPPPALGWAYWCRYPGRAWWARSARIADPSIRTRDAAIAAGAELRAARTAARDAARLAREAAKRRAEVAQVARELAHRCAKGGDPATLDALHEFAAAHELPPAAHLVAQPAQPVRDVAQELAQARAAFAHLVDDLAQPAPDAAHLDRAPERPALNPAPADLPREVEVRDAAQDKNLPAQSPAQPDDWFAHPPAQEVREAAQALAQAAQPPREPAQPPVFAARLPVFAAPPAHDDTTDTDTDDLPGETSEEAAPPPVRDLAEYAAARGDKHAATRAHVRAMLAAGTPFVVRELARETGISESTIRGWLPKKPPDARAQAGAG
ncbi:hypothetical protein [Frankia sp. AgB32]|uniref:hypothetical protein n=1 Tax=Frankia sp. AgB32 TaxID=631119 RepID=UPI00200CFB67|nr:hypothetical protein [Frankia sp. AgB32]MCK9894699.1 hypothetical protein [Frankia sp. AgB32]